MVNPERVRRIMEKSAESEAKRSFALTASAARPRISVPPPPPPARRSSAPPPLPDVFEDARSTLRSVDRQAFPPMRFASEGPETPAQRSSFHLASFSPEGAPSSAVASVRVGRGGIVLASDGTAGLLSQLVAYVGSLVNVLSRDLALDPFHALCAELVGLRVIVFRDGNELVGLLFEPNAEVQRLRQRLGL